MPFDHSEPPDDPEIERIIQRIRALMRAGSRKPVSAEEVARIKASLMAKVAGTGSFLERWLQDL